MFETVNDTLNSYFYNISISQNSSFKVIFIEIKVNIVFSFSDSEAISVSNTLQYPNTVEKKLTGYENWSLKIL